MAGGGVGVNRETTFPVDAPMTWNDPPTLKAKKVIDTYTECFYVYIISLETL